MHFTIVYAYTVKQYLRREQLIMEDLEGLVDSAEVRFYCTVDHDRII